jgi:DNA modification methylase
MKIKTNKLSGGEEVKDTEDNDSHINYASNPLIRKESFNKMTQSEWAKRSRNVVSFQFEARNEFKVYHGATFPVMLARYYIEVYTKPYDVVLDPFLGTASTLEACLECNRNGLGIELNPEFFKKIEVVIENKIQTLHKKMGIIKDIIDKVIVVKAYEESFDDNKINLAYFNEDCKNMLKMIKPDSVNFTFTSPPYADFIQQSLKVRNGVKDSLLKECNSTIRKYSDSPDDLGNSFNYKEFLKKLKPILEANLKVTRTGGYSAWVVKDYRDKDDKTYIDFHSDLAHLGEDVGFKYHDLIVLDQNEHRKLFSIGYPSVFYTNMNSNFIVVFRK